MNAATYARYSSDHQNPSSIEDQQALCRKFAARSGYAIVAEFADHAQSGASTQGRSGLESLMKGAQAGAFKHVIVEALDRLSRDQADLATIFKLLSFVEVEIIDVHHGIANTMQIGIRGMMGGMYLADLANKTRRGLSARVGAGKNAGGRAYGYRPVKGELGELEVVADEAEIVRRIFREYGSGVPQREIAAGLNADRVASPRANVWMANTLIGSAERKVGILRCDLYRGKRVWNKLRYVRDPNTGNRVSRINHESEWQWSDVPGLRLVTDEEWQAVVDRLARQQNGARGRPLGTAKKPRFLSGLIKCGTCGSTMVIGGRDKTGDRVVCCRYQGGRACDHGRQYYVDKIEAFVTEIVAEGSRNKEDMDAFSAAYAESRRKEGAGAEKRRKQAATAFARAQNALNRVLDQYEEGVIDKLAMLDRSARWKAEAASAQAILIEIPPAPDTNYDTVAARAFADAMENLSKTLNTVSAEPAKIELRKLIDSITVFPTEPYKPYDIQVRGPIAALSLVAGARNRLCSSPEIAEIDYSLYAGSWHVAPQFNLCELKTAA